MKKILLSLAATAFALSLYAAPASACPGHDKTTVTKTEKKEDDKATTSTTDKTKKKDQKKKEEAKKPAKEKVS